MATDVEDKEQLAGLSVRHWAVIALYVFTVIVAFTVSVPQGGDEFGWQYFALWSVLALPVSQLANRYLVGTEPPGRFQDLFFAFAFPAAAALLLNCRSNDELGALGLNALWVIWASGLVLAFHFNYFVRGSCAAAPPGESFPADLSLAERMAQSQDPSSPPIVIPSVRRPSLPAMAVQMVVSLLHPVLCVLTGNTAIVILGAVGGAISLGIWLSALAVRSQEQERNVV